MESKDFCWVHMENFCPSCKEAENIERAKKYRELWLEAELRIGKLRDDNTKLQLALNNECTHHAKNLDKNDELISENKRLLVETKRLDDTLAVIGEEKCELESENTKLKTALNELRVVSLARLSEIEKLKEDYQKLKEHYTSLEQAYCKLHNKLSSVKHALEFI
jgi:hypothetical protein